MPEITNYLPLQDVFKTLQQEMEKSEQLRCEHNAQVNHVRSLSKALASLLKEQGLPLEASFVGKDGEVYIYRIGKSTNTLMITKPPPLIEGSHAIPEHCFQSKIKQNLAGPFETEDDEEDD